MGGGVGGGRVGGCWTRVEGYESDKNGGAGEGVGVGVSRGEGVPGDCTAMRDRAPTGLGDKNASMCNDGH